MRSDDADARHSSGHARLGIARHNPAPIKRYLNTMRAARRVRRPLDTTHARRTSSVFDSATDDSSGARKKTGAQQRPGEGGRF
jgi:hypothetical protein